MHKNTNTKVKYEDIQTICLFQKNSSNEKYFDNVVYLYLTVTLLRQIRRNDELKLILIVGETGMNV
jgi:hypothetical protein